MLAFISSSELMVAAVVGLLLFGGRLPEVMKQVGRAWVMLRRALNELKRETGLDEALNEIRREADIGDFSDWRTSMDHAAGPAREDNPAEAQVDEPSPPEPDAEAGAGPGAESEPESESAPAEDDGPVPRSSSKPPEQGGE